MKEDKEKKDKALKEPEDAVKDEPVSGEEASDSAEAKPESEEDAAGESAAKEDAEEEPEEEPADEDGAGEKEPDDADAAKAADGGKNGIFGRKKKKDKRDEKIEELTDRIKRTMAEFENFRKRNEREKSQMYEIGARDIIEKMLPVLDNFERGLAAIPENEKDGAVAQGMEMIYKQMQTVFDQIGVKEIDAAGKEFDPNFHNAVMHEENDEVGENVVTEVLQKGYTYRDSVVRHSMVKVAN